MSEKPRTVLDDDLDTQDEPHGRRQVQGVSHRSKARRSHREMAARFSAAVLVIGLEGELQVKLALVDDRRFDSIDWSNWRPRTVRVWPPIVGQQRLHLSSDVSSHGFERGLQNDQLRPSRQAFTVMPSSASPWRVYGPSPAG